MTITIARSVAEIREHVTTAKISGKTVALVPTMGGLHEGHLSLVEKAGQIADFVVVSIFVNPTQFNNPDDFENYPGNEAEDIEKLEATATNVVFAPDAREMYPTGFSTNVSVTAAGNILCDAHRPGHFAGVATVCTKLFLQTGADLACFGEKDYQQLFIIKTLVRDLNIPISIVPVETVREDDGLAMSSRNKRLSKDERKLAPLLNEHMRKVADDIRAGNAPAKACLDAIDQLHALGAFKVEYLELRSADTLELVETYNGNARLFAAAWLGDVRLIDNIQV